jgi:hypothetical protein
VELIRELAMSALRTIRGGLRRILAREVDAPAFLWIVPAAIAFLAPHRDDEHVRIDLVLRIVV